MNTRPALRQLLENRIDHSALYPPTALSLNDALLKTASFPKTLQNSFMIGSEFVLPLEDLSYVIKAVSEAGLAFKVTGGLHYPFPDAEHPHGFLTLSTAVAFARKFRLPANKILGIRRAKGPGGVDSLRYSDM